MWLPNGSWLHSAKVKFFYCAKVNLLPPVRCIPDFVGNLPQMDSTYLLRFHDTVVCWNAISDGNQSFPFVQYLWWFYDNSILHGSHLAILWTCIGNRWWYLALKLPYLYQTFQTCLHWFVCSFIEYLLAYVCNLQKMEPSPDNNGSHALYRTENLCCTIV